MAVQERPPIRVSHMGGHRFLIRMHKHALAVDQPVHGGGLDGAPTSVELFVGSLAACIADSAREYLDRHGIEADGLQVTADFDVAQRPPRVTTMRVHVKPPVGLPREQYPAFRAVASHCTVHNTLLGPPVVSLELETHPLEDSGGVSEDGREPIMELISGRGAP